MFPHQKKFKTSQNESTRLLSLKKEIDEVKEKLKEGKITANKAAALLAKIGKKYSDLLK